MMNPDHSTDDLAEMLGDRAEKQLFALTEGIEGKPAVTMVFDAENNDAHIFGLDTENLTPTEIRALCEALKVFLLAKDETVDLFVPHQSEFRNN